jgi:drug/metabolite transporter (DMT)-like permease
VLGVGLGLLAGLCSAWAMIGQPTKLPGAITLYFTGFGSGVSVAVIAFQHRLRRRSLADGLPGGGQPAAADDRVHPDPR